MIFHVKELFNQWKHLSHLQLFRIWFRVHSVNAGKVAEQCRNQLLLEPASKNLKLSQSFWTI